jgi:hypothetical protein
MTFSFEERCRPGLGILDSRSSSALLTIIYSLFRGFLLGFLKGHLVSSASGYPHQAANRGHMVGVIGSLYASE